MDEKGAIKILNRRINQLRLKFAITNEDLEAIETALNLLEKKDEIIDLMVETLSKQFNNYEPCWLDDEMECKKYKNCEDCIKEYYENKVTDTNVGERKVENGN